MKKTDQTRALRHLMNVLGVEGQSGRERAIADRIKERLLAAGCREAWVREDGVARRLGPGFEVGNLIVRIPGRRRGARRLLLAHMDVVPLCLGARPVRRGNRIVAKGKTGLGADNRTSVAVLLSTVDYQARMEYYPFRLPVKTSAVRIGCDALKRAGLTPATEVVNGGMDANPLNERGLPTVSFGSGAHAVHSLDEYVDIPQFLAACRIAWELATAGGGDRNLATK